LAIYGENIGKFTKMSCTINLFSVKIRLSEEAKAGSEPTSNFFVETELKDVITSLYLAFAPLVKGE